MQKVCFWRDTVAAFLQQQQAAPTASNGIAADASSHTLAAALTRPPLAFTLHDLQKGLTRVRSAHAQRLPTAASRPQADEFMCLCR